MTFRVKRAGESVIPDYVRAIALEVLPRKLSNRKEERRNEVNVDRR
jgi:hypothetical protein